MAVQRLASSAPHFPKHGGGIAAATSPPSRNWPQRSAIKHIIIKIPLSRNDLTFVLAASAPLPPPPSRRRGPQLKLPPEETRRHNYTRHKRPVITGRPNFNTHHRGRTARQQPSPRVKLAVKTMSDRPKLLATNDIVAPASISIERYFILVE